MQARGPKEGITEVTFLRLTTSAAIGAAALGAKTARCTLPLDYSAYAEIFHVANYEGGAVELPVDLFSTDINKF